MTWGGVGTGLPYDVPATPRSGPCALSVASAFVCKHQALCRAGELLASVRTKAPRNPLVGARFTHAPCAQRRHTVAACPFYWEALWFSCVGDGRQV